MKNFWDIAKGVIGNILFALLMFFGVSDYIFKTFVKPQQISIVSIEIAQSQLILIILFIFLVFVWLLISRRRLYVYNGREGAMMANVRLLKKREPKKREEKYILSTRVSFWPIGEESPIRKEFRALLTTKIEKSFHVKRIWQIHDTNDGERLKLYLNMYKLYDNYSVKFFIGKNSYIPEILACYGKVVSVSIPQLNDPRRLTSAFHFYGKKEIRRWEEYFNILWESGIPVKIGNKVFHDNLKKLETLGG